MESNKKAFSKLIIMMSITLVTQLIILVKASIIASNFGASVEMDAFNFSNSISTFIFSFIGSGVTTVLIPSIINKRKQESMNTFITVLYGFSLLCVIGVFFGRRYISTVFGSNSNEFITIACNIMLITLITQFFNTTLGVTTAVFQCEDRFNYPKIVTLFINIILTIWVISDKNISIYKYSVYLLLTMILNVIIQMIGIKKGKFKYKPTLKLKDSQFKEMMNIFLPTVFSAGLYQISLITDTMISSRLGEGQISVLSYSNTLISMINMLLVVNIVTYVYPKIARSISRNNEQEVLFNYIILFNAIMFLISIGFIIVGKEGIKILYERGNFTSVITNSVYICTFIYILGLPLNVMRDILYRYFYAKGNTKETFKNGVSANIVNIVVSIILSNFIGVYGVVLGTLITYIFSLSSILIRFRRTYGFKIDMKKFIVENIKIIFASSFICIVVLYIKSKFSIMNLFIGLIIYSIISVLLYGITLLSIRSKVFKIKL